MTRSQPLAAFAPGALRLPEGGSVAEFAEEFHYRPETVSSMPGKYSSTIAPYQRGVMEAWAEDDCRELIFCCGSQVGKSTIAEVILQYICERDPGPTMWVLPTEDARDEFVFKRLQPLINASKTWRKRLASGLAVTRKLVSFEAMTLYARIPTATDLSQKSARYVILDEIDKLPANIKGEGSPYHNARTRTKTYPNSKIGVFSTPGEFPSQIYKLLADSNLHRWHVACPCCGERSPWDWHQVQAPRPRERSYSDHARMIEDNKQEVWYECPKCKGRIEESKKAEMNDGGVWISDFPDRGRKRLGYHAPSLVSPFTTFRSLAVQWFDAMAARERGDEGPIQTFVQQEIAEPYKKRRIESGASAIVERVANVARGTVPDGYDALVAGVDVQRDCAYWGVLAGKLDGPASVHLIDWGVTSSENLHELDKLIEDGFAVQGENYRRHLDTLFIDSGDGARTNEIYRWALLHEGIARPIKGSNIGLDTAVRATKDASGDHGGLLCMVDTDRTRTLWHELLSKPPQAKRLTFARGVETDKQLLRQITAQARLTSKTAAGNTKRSWTASGPDHYADAITSYGIAALMMAGLGASPELPREQMPQTRANNPEPSTWISGARRRGKRWLG